MKNVRIRVEALSNGVRFWEIAEALGISDSNFSKKLRNELPEAETDRIVSLIRKLADERERKEHEQ